MTFLSFCHATDAIKHNLWSQHPNWKLCLLSFCTIVGLPGTGSRVASSTGNVGLLNGQNQQLAKHNQQLRQEIEKAVQSVLQLQQVVDSTVVNRTYVTHHQPDSRPEPGRPVSVPRSLHRSAQPLKSGRSAVEGSFPIGEARSGFSENLFTEEEASSYRRRYRPETASEISGRRLAIAILLIIITAFGASYLIVRPLLSNR